ncbi:MAG: glycine--tRNA ligase [Desulfurococcales archaeon ex4484_58]|nr:MAG: glycine--tRNA ligase [Desulfurococcales archaeon ex4484_58]
MSDLAKRRGLYWLSYEIYGGVAGLYDFGPIGVLIKRNIMNEWLHQLVYSSDLVVEIETPIITPRIVLKASGHEDHFTDPITECKSCGRVYRADHLIEEQTGIKAEGLTMKQLWSIIREKNIKCPECGGELTKPQPALLLFKTEIGPYKGSLGYIRPETAQGMFVSFKQVLNVARNRLPLGIAQIGKVGRNEISPRQGLMRLREFTIMEFEFFFDPERSMEEVEEILDDETANETLYILRGEEKEKGIEKASPYKTIELIREKIVKNPWMAYWMARGNIFLKNIGIPEDKIRFEEKLPWEKAHYSEQTFDQQVWTRKFGWIEVAGYSYRTTYDLDRHMEFSGADLTFFKKYEKPVEKEVVKVSPNPHIIRNIVGKDIGLVMKALKEMDKDEILANLEEKGYIEIHGYKLKSNAFIIRREKQKIHGEKIIPHVVEPSFGLERIFYAVLENNLEVIDDRLVLKLPPRLAPYQVAVFPLVSGSKAEHKKITRIAREIYRLLIKNRIRAIYDEEGSIGRRYARVDEIGVPYAITVDYQTLEDSTVTIRFRDTREQIRVHLDELYDKLLELLGLKHSFKININQL